MLENCNVILIFSIYDQFGAIQEPDSGHRACKTYVLFKLFILQKLKTELKNLYRSSHTIALTKDTIFAKNTKFLQKNADISKIKGALTLKDLFSETTYVCVLTCQIWSF